MPPGIRACYRQRSLGSTWLESATTSLRILACDALRAPPPPKSDEHWRASRTTPVVASALGRPPSTGSPTAWVSMGCWGLHCYWHLPCGSELAPPNCLTKPELCSFMFAFAMRPSAPISTLWSCSLPSPAHSCTPVDIRQDTGTLMTVPA